MAAACACNRTKKTGETLSMYTQIEKCILRSSSDTYIQYVSFYTHTNILVMRVSCKIALLRRYWYTCSKMAWPLVCGLKTIVSSSHSNTQFTFQSVCHKMGQETYTIELWKTKIVLHLKGYRFIAYTLFFYFSHFWLNL